METTPTNTTKTEIYARLAALGVAQASIHYDGAGDSGCIDGVFLFDAAEKPIDIPEQDIELTVTVSRWNDDLKTYVQTLERQNVPLRRAIESWCYDLLEQHFAGWEIDGGSSGDIELNIATGSGVIEHSIRVTDYLYETAEV